MSSKPRTGWPGRGSHLRLVEDHIPPIGTPRPPGATPDAPARRRVEIIPLPEPAGADAPRAPATAPPSPRSTPTTGVRPDARFRCPACDKAARVDLVDLTTRRVHLSCDRCYRMWQENTRAGDPAWPRSRP